MNSEPSIQKDIPSSQNQEKMLEIAFGVDISVGKNETFPAISINETPESKKPKISPIISKSL